MNVEKITEVTTYNLTLTKDEYTILTDAMRYICAVPTMADLRLYRASLDNVRMLTVLRTELASNL